MIPENMVEYAPETQYMLVKVMFDKEPVILRIPADTTWIIREDHFLYVTSYSGELTNLDSYTDYHKREWLDYKNHKDDYNKKYLGKISSDIQFKKRCCAWKV